MLQGENETGKCLTKSFDPETRPINGKNDCIQTVDQRRRNQFAIIVDDAGGEEKANLE
jgi:hypothetical protein